ncbi:MULTISPECIES: DnaJ domain-containing protein [unclassified Campylobacter]|uniref:DnaJ domain-containing protein n=1 Tax=unclassified Campylobacter TaxID=2593542 RepID=UPI0022E9E90B|nr:MULTISPECIES: DnaJ domain-containing protein [unclassified Campylobacter]MDA3053868.1 DnaJ domain-containing protein [Campylobacter sp. VBCF_07 NA4]MDA3061753.1 DnaJ domain-containing protein [Campylobacter sp. JMF_14 EL1]MDA3069759.1 DnaJ domain-containing protein [Campylobacter sp. VBCF_08 NA3]MDA3073141.1 DnaJ domain-containing protein [Campylobacter sp. JMF_10 EL2]WBR54911.1 DnaJ domain-containing protein [Campylobacter sp. VBCF_01 NA2]
MSSIFYLFLAFLLYHFIKGFISGISGNSGYERKEPKMSLEEAKILITLTAKVAKSDGVVNETEATMIGEILDDLVRKMGGGENERKLLKQVYKINKDKEHDIYSLAFHYNQKFHLSSSRKAALIYFFLNIAYIDRSFSEQERDIIAKIARGFGMPSHVVSQIFAMFEASYYGTYGGSSQNYDNRGRGGYQNSRNSGGYGDSRGGSYGGNYGGGYQNSSSGGGYGGSARNTSSKKDPYEVLGVDKSASFGEIKKKYRELVKKYHPDILMGKGADDEIIQEGTKKLQEINEAYESLKEKFGE